MAVIFGYVYDIAMTSAPMITEILTGFVILQGLLMKTVRITNNWRINSLDMNHILSDDWSQGRQDYIGQVR